LAQSTAPAFFHGSLPIDLAGNLDGVDLVMDIGTECITDKTRDNCLAFQFEQIFVPANRDFSARLTAVRGPDDGVLDYREGEGAHSWNWWPLWLRQHHLPFLLARLDDPRPVEQQDPPATPRPAFRYRSVAPRFSVWGYDVVITRAVREFLDLSAVTADGLVVQGSGSATIHTAARYVPAARYQIEGAGAAVAQQTTADADGRLTFDVDLGPSHAFEQFTAAATVAENAGDYWVVRRIVITPAPVGEP
jgi:hypothetical protein